jgi:acyl-CoA dehydrogenase
MAWDFSTDADFEPQLEWMRGFVRDEILPLETLDLDEVRLRAAMAPLQEQVKQRGLWAAHLDRELGGGGFGQVRLALMHEIIGISFLAPLAFGNQAPDSGNAELLAVAATAEQRDRWLRPLLDGSIRSCFAMTEPGAGADPTLLTTTAVEDGDEWVITGHKWFASNASVADILLVMCVTAPDAEPHRRASVIVVPVDTPGVEILRDIPTMEHPYERAPVYGNHSEIVFREARVPVGNVVGGVGDGFTLGQKRLGPGRIHHCMRWLGQSQRALDMLCERAVTRYTHGSLLADKQFIQGWVADSVAEMHAARLMTLHAAWLMDTVGARAARREIAMIKYFGAGVLYNVVDRAIQIHGALGYSSDLPLESMYRLARAARIYDGPDEVHRVTVARLVLRDYEPAEVPTEHVPTRRAAARERFADLLDTVTAND